MNTQFLAKALGAEFCTDNWWGVYRALYNGTCCGVTVGITLGEDLDHREIQNRLVHDTGIDGDQENSHYEAKYVRNTLPAGTNRYCDDLRNIPLTVSASAIMVSSIVEGVDECTDTEVIELDKFTRSRDVIRAIYKACDSVEQQAEEIWKRTHGCLTCAKHWDGDTPGDPSELTEDTMDWGDTPVWSDCPDCGGSGAVI